MHLGECLDSLGIDSRLPGVNEWNTGDRILELRRFDGDDETNHLAEQVHRILAQDDIGDARTLFSCVAEALDNVGEHSGADSGWCALQQYTEQGSKSRVSFAVGDCGFGLRTTLAHAYRVSSDEEAIQLAATRGISGTGDSTRGEGLPGIIENARSRNGHITVVER